MSKGEEREFRIRPRKPPIPRQRDERLAWAMAFKTVAHFARSSRAMKVGSSKKRATRYVTVPRKQRCAVRVTYTRNVVRGQWGAHGRYLVRESAATEPSAAGFDATTAGKDVAATLQAWQAAHDQRLWKIIISPEFGERTDLTALTLELMARMEKDLAAQLEWVAVGHFNTEHPHVHVALRGVSKGGEEIRLPRDYVKAGLRSIAEDLCTRQLGHRTEMDAFEAERREIREKRFTSLDRMILRSAAPDSNDPYSTLAVATRDPTLAKGSGSARQQHVIARLAVLAEMGLASRSGGDNWRVRADFESVLRAMQRAGDRQKTLKAHGALLSDERLPVGLLDFRQTPFVEGRVLVHGEDEQTGRRYLMLEGVDARVHYVEYTPEIDEARSRGELKRDSFVRLRRTFIGEEATLDVEDLGNSGSLLKNRRYFAGKAQELLKGGILPEEQGWGGWLGQYQRALKGAAIEIERPAPRQQKRRERSIGR
jgi:type IV secretory pathway VirD2 relaxase